MALKKLTQEEKAELAQNGFVRVDELRAEYFGNLSPEGGEPVIADDWQLGQWSQNERWSVIIARDGTIWLKAGPIANSALIRHFAPCGEGAMIPERSFDSRDILCRVADPDYMPPESSETEAYLENQERVVMEGFW